MIVGTEPDVHLTYCTNIHAGESWDEVFGNISTHVLAVKRRVSPHRPFGVGLRLSAAAARGLWEPGVLPDFREFLRINDLYVFTINGFPYGAFHGTRVKEDVYRPDWLEDQRLTYADLLASILAELLPRTADLEGSISTVPGCFRERGTLPDVGPALADRLLRHAATLWRLRERGGPTIGTALEPEPHCAIETTAEALTFFEDNIVSSVGVRTFCGLTGLAPAAAEDALRRHLGLCFDACHAAVEFEDPAQSLQAVAAAGIRVLKVQLSAGLRIEHPDAESLRALSRFAEGVYLHQVVVRKDGRLHRFVDLPEALAALGSDFGADEWRVHFHVPLFRQSLGPFANTQTFLATLLERHARRSISRHLEVETYTWDVLPEEFRNESVDDAIVRELTWVTDTLASAGA